MLAALLIGLAIGASYAVLYTRLGVPSFVFSLAGLLGFQGALLYVLGANGTINLPADSGLVEFARQKFLSDAQAYALIAVVVLVYVASQVVGIRRRQQADLTPQSIVLVVVKAVLLAVGLSLLTWYLGIDRGWGYLPLFFAALVVIVDLALRKTRWGRHVFAVGGNEEAARRSGIKVNRIYFSVFALTSVFAAVGGLLAAWATDLGVAEQWHHRHQPDRHRGGRHRWHQPVRRTRVGVRRDARDRRAPGDPERPEHRRRRLVGEVHGDRCGAAARRGDRLGLPSGAVRERSRLTLTTTEATPARCARVAFVGRAHADWGGGRRNSELLVEGGPKLEAFRHPRRPLGAEKISNFPQGRTF